MNRNLKENLKDSTTPPSNYTSLSRLVGYKYTGFTEYVLLASKLTQIKSFLLGRGSENDTETTFVIATTFLHTCEQLLTKGILLEPEKEFLFEKIKIIFQLMNDLTILSHSRTYESLIPSALEQLIVSLSEQYPELLSWQDIVPHIVKRDQTILQEHWRMITRDLTELAKVAYSRHDVDNYPPADLSTELSSLTFDNMLFFLKQMLYMFETYQQPEFFIQLSQVKLLSRFKGLVDFLNWSDQEICSFLTPNEREIFLRYWPLVAPASFLSKSKLAKNFSDSK